MNDMNNFSGQPQQDYSMQGNYATNQGYAAATSLQIRLDTSKILSQVEAYLKGERTVLVDVDGNGSIDSRSVWKGKRKVNDEGLQSIMMFLEMVLNPSVVQGNFSDTKGKSGYMQYAEYLCRTRMDFADYLMKNMQQFDIKDEDYNGIISTIMRTIEPFMTRLLYNEERKNYANTIRSIENLQTGGKNKGFHIPFLN
jgi:hypothetical protein